MKYDVEREPSDKMVELAKRDYGERLSDIRYDAIAMFIAQGETAVKAYRRAFPETDPESAAPRVSKLCAHPDMRDKIRDQQVTARNLITAALPRSVRKTVELMDDAESESVQLKAASSIQDRAGLPPRAELSVHATITGASLYQSASDDADILDLTPEEDMALQAPEPAQKRLNSAPGLPPSPTPTPEPLEALEKARQSWASLIPKPS